MADRAFGLGKETTWGTAVAPTRFLEATSEKFRTESQYLAINTMRSRVTRKNSRLRTKVVGEADFALNLEELHTLFFGIMGGQVAPSGAGPYVHVLPPVAGIGIRPSFTAEVNRVDLASGTAYNWRYNGCVMTGIEVVASLDDICRIKGQWLGKGETSPAAASPTFLPFNVVPPDKIAIAIGGVAQPAQGFRLKVDRPADEANILGTTVLGRKPSDNGPMVVEGSIDILFESMTEYNLFLNATLTDILVTLDIGTEEATFDMNKVQLRGGPPSIDGRQRLKATYDFAAEYDTDATENLQVSVTNNVSTAAFT